MVVLLDPDFHQNLITCLWFMVHFSSNNETGLKTHSKPFSGGSRSHTTGTKNTQEFKMKLHRETKQTLRGRVGTLSDLQLPAGVSQSREQVQFDAGLGAQVVLQMLSFLLHGRQSGQQHVRLFLHTAVLSKSLSPKSTSTVRTCVKRQNINQPRAMTTWGRQCFGFLSTSTSLKCNSQWCFFRLHVFGFIHLGNQCTAEKTISTHWWWNGQPFKKHESCTLLHWGMILSVLTTFSREATCTLFLFIVFNVFMNDLASVSACFMESMSLKWNQIPHSTTTHLMSKQQKQPYKITAHWYDDKVQYVGCRPK